jgi:hypothetical protein
MQQRYLQGDNDGGRHDDAQEKADESSEETTSPWVT